MEDNLYVKMHKTVISNNIVSSISKENGLYEGGWLEETIPFEEFQQRAQNKGLVGTFPPYHFEIKEQ